MQDRIVVHLLHASFIGCANGVQKVGVPAEPISVRINVFLHCFVILELILPGAPAVVRLSRLQTVQHRFVIAHYLGQVLDAHLTVKRVVLIESGRVHLELFRSGLWV